MLIYGVLKIFYSNFMLVSRKPPNELSVQIITIERFDLDVPWFLLVIELFQMLFEKRL